MLRSYSGSLSRRCTHLVVAEHAGTCPSPKLDAALALQTKWGLCIADESWWRQCVAGKRLLPPPAIGAKENQCQPALGHLTAACQSDLGTTPAGLSRRAWAAEPPCVVPPTLSAPFVAGGAALHPAPAPTHTSAMSHGSLLAALRKTQAEVGYPVARPVTQGSWLDMRGVGVLSQDAPCSPYALPWMVTVSLGCLMIEVPQTLCCCRPRCVGPRSRVQPPWHPRMQPYIRSAATWTPPIYSVAPRALQHFLQMPSICWVTLPQARCSENLQPRSLPGRCQILCLGECVLFWTQR